MNFIREPVYKEIIIDTILNSDLRNSFIKKHPNSNHKLDDLIDSIIYVLKSGISWRLFIGNINWNTLYQHFRRFTKYGIFITAHNKILNNYVNKNKENLETQITDTTFILNKNGRENIERNKLVKNKNCNKISILTDIKGLPLDVIIKEGNIHDSQFVEEHIMNIQNSGYNNGLQNKEFLADAAYDSKKIRQLLEIYNYKPKIPINKRNSKKDIDKIKHKNKSVKNTNNKRIKVEHSFSELKRFKKIDKRYDVLINSFMSFVYMAISIMIIRRL